MFRFTEIEKTLCMDRTRDCAVRFHVYLQSLDLGSSDPHSPDFDGLAYLRDECLTKHPSLGDSNTDARRKELAYAKLMDSDQRCKIQNSNGYDYSHIESSVLSGILKTAQALVANLLTGFESHFLNDCSFSNGASQGFKLRDAAPFKKIAGQATVTAPAYDIAVAAVKTCAPWYVYMQETYGDETKWFRRVYGNGLFSVPKNNKIDRAACKEPDMNMYLQKGAGSFIRKRLRSVGIDLNDQTCNQELARLGSIDGSLATIDLSSASDSVSDRLVWDLLPPHVYSYLARIRSSFTMIDGRLHKWGLFSTMGNGFTFELESMIFWALSKSVMLSMGVTGSLGIYGDDIIVPVECAPTLLKVLSAVNFLPNEKKTFTTGYFRESCGAHFFKGADMKPFYCKRPMETLPDVLLLCNRIRGWQTVGGMSDPRLFPIWKEFADMIPPKFKGGCNLDRDTYLVSPDKPGVTLVRIAKVRSGFNHTFPYGHENGRYVHWLHMGSGEVLETISSARFRCKPNSEWRTQIPLFPQELEACVLS